MNAQLPTNISPASDADLPAVYASARTALAQAATVDECKDWIDKSKALAVYARQAEDHLLEQMAQKIRARAYARMGEVWGSIEAEHGANQGEKLSVGHATESLTPKQAAAKDAGLPYDIPGEAAGGSTIKTATNIAALGSETLDAILENPEGPPTITALSQMGAQAKKDAKVGPKPMSEWTVSDFITAGKVPPEPMQLTDEYQEAFVGLLGRTHAQANAALAIVLSVTSAAQKLSTTDPVDPLAVFRPGDRASIITAAQSIAQWLAAIHGRLTNDD